MDETDRENLTFFYDNEIDIVPNLCSDQIHFFLASYY